MYRKLTATVVAFVTTIGISVNAGAVSTQPVITLEMAKKMIDACEATAKKEGWLLNIAVVDAGANLVAFRRMNGAFLGSIDIALNKARTSARFPFSTRFIAELAYGKEGKPGMVPGIAHVDEGIAFAGGLPSTSNKVLIGGIGTSGATADQDEICAQAGIDAVAADL